MIENRDEVKTALLVIPYEDVNDTALRMEELEALVDTMGLKTLSGITFRIREYSSATMLGSGQVEELKENILFHGCDCVVFDTSLSPRILRNLEAALDCCVIDREEVILQIFADRAKTREAKLQVALARAEYSLPRLRRRWEDLSQQRGGVKGSRGAGERQLGQIAELRFEELRQQIDGTDVAEDEREDDAADADHEADERILDEHLQVRL